MKKRYPKIKNRSCVVNMITVSATKPNIVPCDLLRVTMVTSVSVSVSERKIKFSLHIAINY